MQQKRLEFLFLVCALCLILSWNTYLIALSLNIL